MSVVRGVHDEFGSSGQETGEEAVEAAQLSGGRRGVLQEGAKSGSGVGGVIAGVVGLEVTFDGSQG